MNGRLGGLGWLLIVAGAASIGGGWAGVQSTPVVAVQLSYLVSGGLVGVALVIVGTALLRQDDLRVIRQLAEELREQLDDVDDQLAGVVARLEHAATAPDGGLAPPSGAKRAARAGR